MKKINLFILTLMMFGCSANNGASTNQNSNASSNKVSETSSTSTSSITSSSENKKLVTVKYENPMMMILLILHM